MRYRLVIFDLDGTLADTFPWFLSVLNDFAEAYRFKKVRLDEADTLRHFGSSQIIRHLGIPSWKLPWIARGFRSRMAQEIDQIRLFEGTGELLDGLWVRGIQVGLVTSNSEKNALRILGTGHAAKIRYFRCGVSVFGKRPQIRKVMRLAGTCPSETLYIGDEIRDLEAARAEKVDFGAVAWGYTHPEALESSRPEYLFRAMKDILEGIRQASSRS